MSDGKQDRKHKDKAMAAYLKKMGVQRNTKQCPMCHHTIGINVTIHPPANCQPRRPQYGRVRGRQ
jgi:hypothetical protein